MTTDEAREMTKSGWEIIPKERGTVWLVEKMWTAYVQLPDGQVKMLSVPKGYPNDRYTVGPDTNDCQPAEAHDYSWDMRGSGRRWDDGTPIAQADSDFMLFALMRASKDEPTRFLAEAYYSVLRRSILGRLVGWWKWQKGTVWAWLHPSEVGYWRKQVAREFKALFDKQNHEGRHA